MRHGLLILLLAGCPIGPRTDDDPADESDTDTDTDTDSDTDSDTDADSDTDTDPPDSILLQGGAVTCANPAARAEQPFDRLAVIEDEVFDVESPSLFVGGGLAVADLTGDGVIDLFLPSRYDLQFLVGHEALDGTLSWTDATDTLPPFPERTAGATVVDYDGDADLDLFIATFRGFNLLFENDGTGQFTDVTDTAGLAGNLEGRNMSNSWGDWDGDGDLDPFVAGYGELGNPLPDGDPSSIYRNNGDGTFTDFSSRLPSDHQKAHTFIGNWTDIDGDRIPELYLVNDFGWYYPNPVLRYDGANFVEDHTVDGLDVSMESMGLGIGDLNDDEIQDFIVAAWNRISLLLSDGTSTAWWDHAASAGIGTDDTTDRNVAWGTELNDLDNDGDLDAFVAFGFLKVSKDNPKEQPDALFVNDGSNAFTQEAEAWGVADTTRSRGFVVADINNDGWLDMLKRDLRGPTLIDIARCGDDHWLRVGLSMPGMNRFGIGAKVRITKSSGQKSWVRWVQAGGTSYTSSKYPEVHFGLGTVDLVDIDVFWPDGMVDHFDNVGANQRVTVQRYAPFEPAP